MLSLHTFSTPLLCILNLSAWNYKGHLHSEKLFQFHRFRFKKIYIQSQTPNTEFFEAETRKKKQPFFPLWIFLQDNHLAPTLHLYSALPGQAIPRGVKLPDPASKIWKPLPVCLLLGEARPRSAHNCSLKGGMSSPGFSSFLTCKELTIQAKNSLQHEWFEATLPA